MNNERKDAFELDELETRMLDKFTMRKRYGRTNTVWFTSGVQSFKLNCDPDTAHEAEWFRCRLAKALATLVKSECSS